MIYKSPLESKLFIKNNELSVVTDKHNTVILTTNNSVKGLVNKFSPISVNKKDIVEIEALEYGRYFRKKTSMYVLKTIDYISFNYKKKISIQDLVDILGVSSTFLNNEFKKETTYTFNDYLNRFRINKAIDIMKNSDEKIYNIATDVGFKDYRYFINVFKKYTDCTPSDFR